MKTGLQINTSFFPLAWFLYFVTPTIEINDQRIKRKWGRHFFEMEPGAYKVRISFPYFGMTMGANQVNVTVEEGQQRIVSYNMPPFMFAKGTMRVR